MKQPIQKILLIATLLMSLGCFTAWGAEYADANSVRHTFANIGATRQAKPSMNQPRNYVEKDFGIPKDSVRMKKFSPKKSYSDDYGDTYYGIILDGTPYYYVGEVTFSFNFDYPALEFDGDQSAHYFFYFDENKLQTTIPDRNDYVGMYTTESGLTPNKLGYEGNPFFPLSPNVENFIDYACLAFNTKEEFRAYAQNNNWTEEKIDERLEPWDVIDALASEVLAADGDIDPWGDPYEDGHVDGYNAWYKAMEAKRLGYDDDFIALDASQYYSSVELDDTYGYYWTIKPRWGCLPTIVPWPKDGRTLNGVRSCVANMKVETLDIPSKVKMLRWIPDNSATDIFRTYTPDLTTVNFASTENMRQIGGFANHKKLTTCPIGTLTGLKVIEAECFKNCTSLNVGSVDLRGMWVGTEAFNGVSASHLDIDITNTQKGEDAKLYNVKCKEIKIYHAADDNTPLDPAKFLKKVNGHYVLDDANYSKVLVPCRLYDDYIIQQDANGCGWIDIADQISYYKESPDDGCPDPVDPDDPTPESSSKWSTICFPFKPSKTELDAIIGDKAIVAEYTAAKLADGYPKSNANEEDEYSYELTFTTIDHASILCNTPYLIRPSMGQVTDIPMYDDSPSTTSTAYNLYKDNLPDGVNYPVMTDDRWTDVIETKKSATGDTGTDIIMKGTYQQTKLHKAEFYLKNVWDDTDKAWSMNFYKAAADNQVNVNPFRCYFRIEKGGVPITNAKIGNLFNIEEEVNGITTITRQELSRGRLGIYTLSGQCIARNSSDFNMNQLPAGIYIVNGEKVVKK